MGSLRVPTAWRKAAEEPSLEARYFLLPTCTCDLLVWGSFSNGTA